MYRPTVAVIEDKRPTREYLRLVLSTPPAEWQRETGISGFDVKMATDATEGRALLSKAREGGNTFDVLWFDLGLPLGKNYLDVEDDPQVGLRILREIREEDTRHPDRRVAGNIIVASAYGREGILEDLIRTQIVQYYVRKPWDAENRIPFLTVVDAYRSHSRRRWSEYKQTRLIAWAKEAARVQVGVMAQDLTNQVSAAMAESRKLTELIEESYHLNALLDKDDPVCLQCKTLNETITDIARKCGSTQRSFDFFEKLMPALLATTLPLLIEKAIDSVTSGLAAKVIRIDCANARDIPINDYSHVILMILKEMLFGAIERSAFDSTVSISVEYKQWVIAITVCDCATPLTSEECVAIENALPITPVGGHAWGLALAQFVALNIGARLEVRPEDPGNSVTLHLPFVSPP